METNAPFTVKHVGVNGSVCLYPARCISTVPYPEPGSLPNPNFDEYNPRLVEFDMGDGSGIRSSIDSGRVYVMNQNGQTVQQFHFPIRHASDCAMHNGPAMDPDKCDCGAQKGYDPFWYKRPSEDQLAEKNTTDG